MKRELTYATVCSGIECMSVACIGLPMRPVFFSEIEPFPCAVLKAHYPNVPNLGDMSKIQVSENGLEITNGTTRIILDRRIDLLAGGTPCQSVSVAGKGEGMREGSGTRSSLAFDFVRLARELRPRWIVWENVANVLSAKHAGDFLHFLANLGDCGYSLAWRVLDAQYVRVDGMERAVPQRRRRVWVVGCLGADVTLPAQILFEPDCVAGHTPPRRRAGQGFAYSLAGRDRVDAGVVGEPAARDDSGCLNPNDSLSKRIFGEHGAFHSVCAGSGGGQLADGVCIALDGDKLKPREDQRKGGNGFGINEEGAGYTLTGVDRHGVAYSAQGGEVASTITRQISEQSGQDNRANAVVQIANGVSFDGRKDAPIADGVAHSQTIGTNPGFKDGVVVSMAQNTRDEVRIVGGDGQIAGALPAEPGMKQQTYVVSTQGLDGYNKTLTGDVSPTVTAKRSDLHHVPGIISTNSNGEDVAATINANMSKLGGDNQTTFWGGGGVLHHPPRGRSAR